MYLADTPSGGLLIGLPLTILLAVGFVALGAVFSAKVKSADDFDKGMFKWLGRGAVAGAILTVVITAFSFWPYKHDYHFWVEKQGRVEKIGKRIISTGDSSISQRFVFTIAGRPYGVDDTRASLAQVGDYVKLACKREFEWGVPQSANGWACKWRRAVR